MIAKSVPNTFIVALETADELDLKRLKTGLLNAHKKKADLLPNSCRNVAIIQAFVEGALQKMGLDSDKVSAEGSADMTEKGTYYQIHSY